MAHPLQARLDAGATCRTPLMAWPGGSSPARGRGALAPDGGEHEQGPAESSCCHRLNGAALASD